MSYDKPRVMLIGAGKFGVNYIRILKELDEKGEIDFVGVCVFTEVSAVKLKREHNVMATSDYAVYLSELDAVFVVTPPDSHYKIVSECLPYVHVMCEKPLALYSDEVDKLGLLAKENQKTLMTGQLFRFHAVTDEIVRLIKEGFKLRLPKKINAVFTNPNDTYVERLVAFEFIHWFDMVVYLFPSFLIKSVESTSTNFGKVKNVIVRYQNKKDSCKGDFVLGWEEGNKNRTFKLIYEEDTYILADYIDQTITVSKLGVLHNFKVEEYDTLAKEINVFLLVIRGKLINPVPPDAVKESVRIAEQI